MAGSRRRQVSIAVLDPNEVGDDLVTALVADDRVLARVVAPRASAEVALGELLAWRTDIVVIDGEATFGTGWSPQQLVAPLLACGTEVIVRETPSAAAPTDRRVSVDHGAPLDELVDAVRSRYPELRGRPGPPER